MLARRAQAVLCELKAAQATIVTAESCTAGALAAELSAAEGASDVLHGGFIAYTKAQKAAALGVPKRLLDEHSAVSAEVVRHMAQGALDRSPALLAVAVTGVLGPEPDEDGNPVGLVYFCALAKGGRAEVVREEFGELERNEMLTRVIARAMALVETVIRAA
jgi:PncC family amidohydrolase